MSSDDLFALAFGCTLLALVGALGGAVGGALDPGPGLTRRRSALLGARDFALRFGRLPLFVLLLACLQWPALALYWAGVL